MKNNFYIKKLFSIFMFSIFLFMGCFSLVFADTGVPESTGPNLDNLSGVGGFSNGQNVATIANKANISVDRTLPEILNNIISIILGFFTVVVLGIIIYAGIKMIMSKGKSDVYMAGFKMLEVAIVAMFIILLAYTISEFAVNNIAGITGTRNATTAPITTSTVCSSQSQCQQPSGYTGTDYYYCCIPGEGEFHGCSEGKCNIIEGGEECACSTIDGVITCAGVCTSGTGTNIDGSSYCSPSVTNNKYYCKAK